VIQRVLLLLLSIVLLAACIPGGSKRPAATVFDLPTPPQAALTPARPQQLLIAEPRTSQMLDSPRIAVRPQPGQLQVYRGVGRRGAAPKLVYDAMLVAFEDAGAFAAVGRSGSGLRGELLLTLELRRFEAEYRDGSPQAVIELQAVLLRGGSGAALGSRRIRVERAAAGTEPAQVVTALAAASGEAIDQLVRWVHGLAASSPVGAASAATVHPPGAAEAAPTGGDDSAPPPSERSD
jgi:cholesterol transport system auxiliary component